jgi:hypothetical protein
MSAAPSATSRRKTPVGSIVLIVAGALISLVALGVTVGGGALAWVYGTQRDADGFFSTGTERFETTTHAITTEEIDLGARGDRAGVEPDISSLGTLRLRVESVGRSPVFVGIAPQDDVDSYLDGVSHAELEDVRVAPFAASYRYIEGTRTPERPAASSIWVASAEGRGSQTLEWTPEGGRWSVVVMNADATPGVAVNASAGVKASWVLAVAIGLLVGGVLGLVLGAALLVVGIVTLARRDLIDLAGPEPHPEQPVRLQGRLDQPLSRWLWLVKWLLLIPHLVVLAALWIAFAVVTVVAFFAILFTGRYPRSLFEFNVGVLRWTWRVGYYGYSALGTDKYPPFSLAYKPDYPATFEVAYPERLSRGLVLVKWWLLAIPQYLLLAAIGVGVATSADRGWPSLISVLVLFAAIALLFTGQYPRGIHDFVVGLNRWVFRVITYVALMRDEYPPFRLDQGPDEPAISPGPPGDQPTGASTAEPEHDEVNARTSTPF